MSCVCVCVCVCVLCGCVGVDGCVCVGGGIICCVHCMNFEMYGSMFGPFNQLSHT